MARKVDRGRDTYTYVGTPKSYWAIAAKKSARFLKGKKEDPAARERRLKREAALKKLEASAIARRKAARKAVRGGRRK